jgi:hypothetical protein
VANLFSEQLFILLFSSLTQPLLDYTSIAK